MLNSFARSEFFFSFVCFGQKFHSVGVARFFFSRCVNRNWFISFCNLHHTLLRTRKKNTKWNAVCLCAYAKSTPCYGHEQLIISQSFRLVCRAFDCVLCVLCSTVSIYFLLIHIAYGAVAMHLFVACTWCTYSGLPRVGGGSILYTNKVLVFSFFSSSMLAFDAFVVLGLFKCLNPINRIGEICRKKMKEKKKIQFHETDKYCVWYTRLRLLFLDFDFIANICFCTHLACIWRFVWFIPIDAPFTWNALNNHIAVDKFTIPTTAIAFKNWLKCTNIWMSAASCALTHTFDCQ